MGRYFSTDVASIIAVTAVSQANICTFRFCVIRLKESAAQAHGRHRALCDAAGDHLKVC